MTKEVQRYVDKAMFTAEPIKAEDGPKVYLLWMTPDPLAAIAAACKMYKGEVVRSLSDVTHAERVDYIQQVMKTKLQAPFEFVKFHFLFEGVSRSFTHQMVRQRTAAYAQESLRFAVKEDMPQYMPPTLAGTMSDDEWEQYWVLEAAGSGVPDSEWRDYAINHSSREQLMRLDWDEHNRITKAIYHDLIDRGMPAEDARGRLPHDTLTRVQYTTDLRALLDHGGNRLCTQAQFEWRLVWSQIVKSIREYQPHAAMIESTQDEDVRTTLRWLDSSDSWQYETLADVFKPVCYLTGKCEFKANFDRSCSIRDRVEANHHIGRPSSEWGKEKRWGDSSLANSDEYQLPWATRDGQNVIPAIKPGEWLLDPKAAR